MKSSSCRIAGAVLAITLVLAPNVPARGEDFFSMMFRAFGGRRAMPVPQLPPMSYGSEMPVEFPPRYREASPSGGAAYCVRTCDGRYFPIARAANQSPAETCKSFCPAAETRVYYGASIDDATSDKGRDYTDLPNAFKYRTELVAGCSCNGTDPVGLAKINIDDDKTLRRGDFVAAADGLKMVSGRSDRRGAELNFTPAPRSLRARFERSAAVE